MHEVSRAASRGDQTGTSFGELFAEGKAKLDTLNMAMASILPSFPGLPAGKFYDIALGIDFHETIFPPMPLLPVPHFGIVFDILSAIFAAINDAIPPAPPPPPVPEGEVAPPEPITMESIGRMIVSMMKPSVKVNNQWIANAGTSIQHLPGIIVHLLPLVKPMATSEMWMGSSKVMADGTPFSSQYHPALSCNLIGFPSIFRKAKPPKPKMALMAPTSMLLGIIPQGNQVLVGGPPTIDLFALVMQLGLKGLGKLWKAVGDKFQKVIDNIKSSKLKSVLQFMKCKMFGEPVDAATGRVYANNQDFVIPGPIPIEWERTYYSDAELKTSLGYNWHHSFAIGYWDMGTNLALKLKDGREIGLPYLEVGDFYFHQQEKIYWFRDQEGYYYRDGSGYTYRLGQYVYTDGFHPLYSIENPLGFRVEFRHSQNRLDHIIDADGRKHQVEYGMDNYIKKIYTWVNDDMHTWVEYRHDDTGNLISVVNDAGKAKKQFYYDGHLLIKLTNQSGLSFYWEYEGQGDDARCVHTWGDEGILEYWAQYEDGVTRTTNSLGHTTQYFYDENFLIHTIIDAKGGVTKQEYDIHQNLVVVVNPEGLPRKYDYDYFGNLIGITDENESQTRFAYNPMGQLTQYHSPGGASMTWDYDKEGRLIKRRYADKSYSTFHYEGKYLTEIKDNRGKSTRLIWENNLIKEALLPDDNTIAWNYDLWGRVTKEILPNNAVTSYQYDHAGNLISLTEPDGNQHHFAYDAAGNVTSAQDNNRKIEFEYWGLGQLKSRTENGKKIVFDYDTEEQLKGIKNEAGEAYRFTRDPLGNIIGEWGFDGLQRQYVRDAAGRVTLVKRPDSRWTKYQYDGVGNIIIAEHSDHTHELFTYNQDRLLIEAANQESTVKLVRDNIGRVTQEIQNGHTVTSQYDKEGNRITLKSSLGALVNQQYDNLGMLKSIEALATTGQQEQHNPWEARFERDKLGLEIARYTSGGVTATLQRDNTGKVTAQSIGTTKNLEASKKQYIWGPGDRLKQIINQNTGEITSFTHDQAGNLLSAAYQNGLLNVYKMPDAVGNLFKDPDRKDRTYGKGGRLLKDDNWHYIYDAEGNLRLKSKRKIATEELAIQQTEAEKKEPRKFSFFVEEIKDEKPKRGELAYYLQNDRIYTQEEKEEYKRLKEQQTETRQEERSWQRGDWEYRWYGNGMLRSVRRPDGSLVEMEYDALGRRTAKIADGKINRYIWDGNVLLHEWKYPVEERPKTVLDNKGQIGYDKEEPVEQLVTWVYEDGSFTPSAKIIGEEKYSIISDYLGTPVQVFDNKGTLVWDRELDIYGNPIKGDNTFIPFLYQGQYYDKEIELAYNRFRYYDPNIGNYISQDPIGLRGGFVLYEYVHDVNNWLDVHGLSSSILNGNLGGVVGDNMQAHHVIPEEVWKANQDFFDNIGLGGQMDKATNGILLPDKASGIVPGGPQIVHRGSHPEYSAEIGGKVSTIRSAYDNGLIDDKTAKKQIRKLQMEYKNKLWEGDVPHKIVDGKKKLH
jgi:RHS repeat-associated protein